MIGDGGDAIIITIVMYHHHQSHTKTHKNTQKQAKTTITSMYTHTTKLAHVGGLTGGCSLTCVNSPNIKKLCRFG